MRRLATSQEWFIQQFQTEALLHLKNIEALARDPRITAALEDHSDANDVRSELESAFQHSRQDLQIDEPQPDIMAAIDDKGRVLALMVRGKIQSEPDANAYLSSGKLKYDAIRVALEQETATSEVWKYDGIGAMRLAVAPVVGAEMDRVVGAVLAGYAINAETVRHQRALLRVDIAMFYGDELVASSSALGDVVEGSSVKSVFGDGLANAALASKQGMSEIETITVGARNYLATASRLRRYSSKPLDENYQPNRAGAILAIPAEL